MRIPGFLKPLKKGNRAEAGRLVNLDTTLNKACPAMNEISVQGVASVLAQLLEAAQATTAEGTQSIPHFQAQSF
jgi:hypothetical protein